ncbi:MAG TPA: DinB family protein [Vicinamibacteria bacterium]
MDKHDLGRLLAYTEWANHRVIRASATLSTDDWKRDLKSSHGGVRGTLAHTMGAEWIWLERWKGLPNPPKVDEGEFADVTVLSERWQVLNEHRQAWFRGLAEKTVSEPLHYRLLNGTEMTQPLWQLVQHLANHSTYHRGQVIAMLRMLGSKAVATDLVAFDREHPDRSDGRSYALAG